jgi:hypothetical protein
MRLLVDQIGDCYGSGVIDFFKANLVNDPLQTDSCPLFLTAALGVSDPAIAGDVDGFVKRWQGLKPKIGLVDDSQQFITNFPAYHIGNWRPMYLATMLDFFKQLKLVTNLDAFNNLYAQRVALPVIKYF